MPHKTLKSQALAIPCSDVMKLLADETRFKIVDLLLRQPRNVQGLNARLRIDPTLLSHHLRVLREARLIERERRGRYMTYRLSPRVRSSLSARELDFGCCTLRFDEIAKRNQGAQT